jgi:hypothetical protein
VRTVAHRRVRVDAVVKRAAQAAIINISPTGDPLPPREIAKPAADALLRTENSQNAGFGRSPRRRYFGAAVLSFPGIHAFGGDHTKADAIMVFQLRNGARLPLASTERCALTSRVVR